MTPIERARELALAMKLWGRHPYNAIASGQWDNGSIVRQFLPVAEAEALRNRPETNDE